MTTKNNKKLIVVANRLPVTVTRREASNEYDYTTSPGGLVSALSSLKSEYEMLWLGWPGITEPDYFDTDKVESELRKRHGLEAVFLNRLQINHHYFGFSNKVLWPVLHYMPDYTSYEKRSYQHYKEVNQIFADRIIDILEKDTLPIENKLIWIQDYQLMLLPSLLRAKFPELRIGFFLHTPFPSSELFRTLPHREELLQGLIASSLIGFHTFSYQRHFSSSVLHILGIESELSKIKLDTHTLQMGTFPIGVDAKNISEISNSSGKQRDKDIKMVRNITKGRRMILCVDRLDYTKGIPEHMKAYRKFLQKNPSLVDKVVLVQIAVPSRTEIKDYQALKDSVDEIITQFEEDYEYNELSPIRFLYRSFPFDRLAVFYQEADVAFVTPYFDGMNLVAKEYIAVKKDKGVLILSERAGAASELGEALLINPWNSDQMSISIKEALNMPLEEQERRMSAMYEKISRNDVNYWSNSFLKNLEDHSEEEVEITPYFSTEIQQTVVKSFQKAKRRLLLLDYDGTLMEITNLPQNAKPDQELISLLSSLTKLKNTDVAIVTGRKESEIIGWLGHLKLIFSVEHGLRIRFPNEKNWHLNSPTGFVNSWYEEIREILQQYNRTTPGSFTEEKEASLCWHYRMVDPTLGRWKANELKLNLQGALANHPIEVVSAKMVIEIRLQGIDKGNIFERLNTLGYKHDFCLALGDDITDEYMFNAMPANSTGIKVGKVQTHASHRLHRVTEVRDFLRKLLENHSKFTD